MARIKEHKSEKYEGSSDPKRDRDGWKEQRRNARRNKANRRSFEGKGKFQ